MKIEGFCGAVLELDEKKNKEMPEKATVLIFPGGGYSWLSERESHPVERTLHEAGFRAAVLYYDTDTKVLGLTPLKQAAWGLAKVRELYPGDPVYVLGFSAGSHCAGSLAVHWSHRDWEGKELFSEVKAFLGDPGMPPESCGHLRTLRAFRKLHETDRDPGGRDPQDRRTGGKTDVRADNGSGWPEGQGAPLVQLGKAGGWQHAPGLSLAHGGG